MSRVSDETDVDAGPGLTVALEATQLIHILKSSRRRVMLDLLASRLEAGDSQTGYTHLATLVAERESDRDRVRTAKVNSSKAGLRQNHLPLLCDYGLVEWDERSGEITATDDVVDVHHALERIRSWSRDSHPVSGGQEDRDG